MARNRWKVAQSEEVYHILGWGDPYFSINRKGEVAVHPHGSPKKSLSLKMLVDQIVERGISAPFLLRFNDILTHRLEQIRQAFATARKSFEYQGGYTTVYPIKVNQQSHVVEQIAKSGQGASFGLEAGSKPELLAVLALAKGDAMPIVCNGYKDREFFEIAMMGMKMGKAVFPVIEKYSEFETMIEVARELKTEPTFGVRVKLASAGSGKWRSSGGHRSKFGLTVAELLRGIELLKDHGYLKGFNLLHFHLGSQITDIKAIKTALKEGGRVYVELKRQGVPLSYLDVGGGLGVDYDGSRSKQDNSVNYTLQEYANDVVFQIQEICDQAKIEHPHIFAESGRAVASHHAVLILNVLGMTGYDRIRITRELDEDSPKPLRELYSIREDLTRDNILEYYHDAVACYQECLNLFALGYLSIEDRAMAEDLYFNTMIRCRDYLRQTDDIPDELRHLEEELSDTYFCNFSVFQSLPDYWAIDQKFPIMPINRLNEEPQRRAKLADITCDSDGKVDSFINPEDVSSPMLPLHAQNPEDDYYLGAFLVGAYQETLGDLHNLFGDTNAVHVKLDKNNVPIIETVVKGDTVKEVLTYVQYDVADLVEAFHQQLENAVRKRNISLKESGQFLKFYEESLEGYTYLENTGSREDF